MAKADTSKRRDVVTRIRRQHDTIRRLFGEVDSAAASKRPDAFQRLVRLLAVHESAEELVVYPALLYVGSDARKIVRARKAEEDRAKKDLAALEGMDTSSSDFDERFQAFRADIEAHAESEENEVLPLLDEHRASHELRLMDTGFVIAESIAPTHAHRLAPESATGNLLVGPIIGMFDRVRDVLTDAARPRHR